uniref:Galectin n=1 Tax=Plectus sambesii TaxID=2011161 RepID=A0A914VTW4_9BILA
MIPGGMFPGRAIIVKGMVMAGGAKRFQINLCCGLLVEGDHTDNKALHFNPRYVSGDTDIVLNSSINNSWGEEERCNNVLTPGQPFQLRILALTDCFKIAVNGKHLCDYNHRLPLHTVRIIYINGGVQVDLIEYQGEMEAQNIPPQATAPPSEDAVSTGVIRRPPIPFDLPVTGGFTNGRQLILTGTPRMNAETFCINFCSAHETFFHFNVRFAASSEKKNVIVRNSTKNGKWLTEERQASTFPFITGGTFDITIEADADFFKVSVNGAHLMIFNYRDDPKLIDRISIDGDLTLQQAQLI